MRYATIGTVSSDTLRDDDLISAFSWEIEHLAKGNHLPKALRQTVRELLRDVAAYDDERLEYDPSELVDALQDCLGEFAPPYAYFGTHDGDGAHFGFWPITDDDCLPRLNDMAELEDYRGEDVYLVNDHGNVTCGRLARNGRFVEYWSCV